MKDLVIEDEWKTTGSLEPRPFLIYDSGPDTPSRILVFGSEECLWLISKSKPWYMDGNFKMAPRGFLQLHVIRVPLGTTAVPTLYMLLQKKKQATYEEMFRAIIDKCHSINLYPDPTM